MLNSINSKAIVIATLCAALNLDVTTAKAAPSLAALAGHLSSGALLLAADEFNTPEDLGSRDAGDSVVSSSPQTNKDEDKNVPTSDINATEDAAPKDEKKASSDTSETDISQLKASEDRPKEEVKPEPRYKTAEEARAAVIRGELKKEDFDSVAQDIAKKEFNEFKKNNPNATREEIENMTNQSFDKAVEQSEETLNKMATKAKEVSKLMGSN